jgi:hypothetical protein
VLAYTFFLPGVNRVKGSELLPWPQRLTASPPRLEELGIHSDNFSQDNVSYPMTCFANTSTLSDGCFPDLEILISGGLAF